MAFFSPAAYWYGTRWFVARRLPHLPAKPAFSRFPGVNRPSSVGQAQLRSGQTWPWFLFLLPFSGAWVCVRPPSALLPTSAHVHRLPLQALGGFSSKLCMDLRFCRGPFTSGVPAGTTAPPYRDAFGGRQVCLRGCRLCASLAGVRERMPVPFGSSWGYA